MKKASIHEGINIIDAGAEGQAIAKKDNMVIFVKGAVPGDIVTVKITRKKNKYAEGEAIKIESPSTFRTTPECSHFGTCGGCKWQNLEYKHQLHFKQLQVENALKRIGKIELPEINTIIPSSKTYYYRNKLEFAFSDKKWLTKEEIESNATFDNRNGLGFHIPKMFDKVIDINECLLQDNLSNKIRLAIKDFALKNNYSFFNIREQTGLLRSLFIRNTSTGEWMVNLVFFENEESKISKILTFIKNNFKEITSLFFTINSKKNDSIADLEPVLFFGKDHISETMDDLQFRIGPKSFYQTNSQQAYELYKITKEFSGLTGNELVYDLYTGTGTIANFVARDAKKVVGIEYINEAIEDAIKNSALNNIHNTVFFAGDIKNILSDDFVITHGKPDVIITDPPRSGMHEDVVQSLLKIGPQKIVYVSCNPATQARDLLLLSSTYSVKKIQPVDMFPHTHHVENIVLLQKN